jgi:arylsulfatase A-like enzyme
VALKAPVLIRKPGMNQLRSELSDAIVETIDIFPTSARSCRLSCPGRAGRPHPTRNQLDDPGSPLRINRHLHTGTVVRKRSGTEEWRLIVHRPEGETEGFELFDFRENSDGERVNPESYPDVVERLMEKLEHI